MIYFQLKGTKMVFGNTAALVLLNQQHACDLLIKKSKSDPDYGKRQNWDDVQHICLGHYVGEKTQPNGKVVGYALMRSKNYMQWHD